MHVKNGRRIYPVKPYKTGDFSGESDRKRIDTYRSAVSTERELIDYMQNAYPDRLR